MVMDSVVGIRVNTATDVARFLVKEYISMERPTTNMKLQKLLYFAWISYYKKNQRYLFNDRILAWRLGPVVRDVYEEFSVFVANPITFCEEPENSLSEEDRLFLSDFARENLFVSASSLVTRSHLDGKPWKKVYDGIKTSTISYESIIELECQ